MPCDHWSSRQGRQYLPEVEKKQLHSPPVSTVMSYRNEGIKILKRPKRRHPRHQQRRYLLVTIFRCYHHILFIQFCPVPLHLRLSLIHHMTIIVTVYNRFVNLRLASCLSLQEHRSTACLRRRTRPHPRMQPFYLATSPNTSICFLIFHHQHLSLGNQPSWNQDNLPSQHQHQPSKTPSTTESPSPTMATRTKKPG